MQIRYPLIFFNWSLISEYPIRSFSVNHTMCSIFWNFLWKYEKGQNLWNRSLIPWYLVSWPDWWHFEVWREMTWWSGHTVATFEIFSVFHHNRWLIQKQPFFHEGVNAPNAQLMRRILLQGQKRWQKLAATLHKLEGASEKVSFCFFQKSSFNSTVFFC